MRTKRLTTILAAMALTVDAGAAALAAQPGRDVDRGIALFAERRYHEAKSALSAAAADPQDARRPFFLGRVAMIEGDFDDAVRWLEAAARLDDRTAAVQYRLGQAYAQRAARGSKFRAAFVARKARTALERAISLDPELVDARLALVQFYLVAPGIAGGSTAWARSHVAEIQRRSAYRGHIAAAAVLEDRKNVAGAEREYEAAIRAHPDSAAAIYALGLLYQRDGRTADAFDTFDRAVRADSSQTAALYAIGRLAALSGEQLPRGEEALVRYLAAPPPEDSPPLSSAHFRLGAIYERTGRRELARREYEASLRIERRSEVQEALARVR
ncbi:MAG: tetratricopeptide repeat protein [Gemmatimonadota bacterium]|nr:tetratricopeptide repeat protein [Gemmatimonadota bacterium]